PRLASMTAFLCLVVAHFEWPDICYLRCYPPSASTAPRPAPERRTRTCRSALTEAVAGSWPCRIPAILPASPGRVSRAALDVPPLRPPITTRHPKQPIPRDRRQPRRQFPAHT